MSQLFPPRALQYSANVYHCAHPTRGQKAKKTLACDKNRAKEGQAMNLRAKKQLTCNPSFTYLQRDNKISANLFDKIDPLLNHQSCNIFFFLIFKIYNFYF